MPLSSSTHRSASSCTREKRRDDLHSSPLSLSCTIFSRKIRPEAISRNGREHKEKLANINSLAFVGPISLEQPFQFWKCLEHPRYSIQVMIIATKLYNDQIRDKGTLYIRTLRPLSITY